MATLGPSGSRVSTTGLWPHPIPGDAGDTGDTYHMGFAQGDDPATIATESSRAQAPGRTVTRRLPRRKDSPPDCI